MMTPERLAEIAERVHDSIEDEYVCCSFHVVWDRAELLAEVYRLSALLIGAVAEEGVRREEADATR